MLDDRKEDAITGTILIMCGTLLVLGTITIILACILAPLLDDNYTPDAALAICGLIALVFWSIYRTLLRRSH